MGDGRTYGRTDKRTDGQKLKSLYKAGPPWVRQKSWKYCHTFELGTEESIQQGLGMKDSVKKKA